MSPIFSAGKLPRLKRLASGLTALILAVVLVGLPCGCGRSSEQATVSQSEEDEAARTPSHTASSANHSHQGHHNSGGHDHREGRQNHHQQAGNHHSPNGSRHGSKIHQQTDGNYSRQPDVHHRHNSHAKAAHSTHKDKSDGQVNEDKTASIQPKSSSDPGEPASFTAPEVQLFRTPQNGIQPQVAVEPSGTVHMIYFRGDAGAGDLYYVRKGPRQQRFSEPIRVNSHSGSAVALGTIRGGQIAVGQNGRVHVVWNGSRQGDAQPKAPGGKTPVLYTRTKESGAGFEPQRNLIDHAFGLDGGSSVAADSRGNVWVTWHAGKGQGESARNVWVAHSTDGGKTFSREQAAWSRPTGACSCCSLKTFADSQGTLYTLYRSATDRVHRDMFLLTSGDKGDTFQGRLIHKWKIASCPMSSANLVEGPSHVYAAWETRRQVYFARINPSTLELSDSVAAPGDGKKRKHPVLAVNAQRQVLFAWTEGTGWNQGGSVAWQIYNAAGKALDEAGRKPGLPAWSLVAAYARPGGGFTIVY